MAIYTVRGNKTTKELKKGVSIVKKSCFKVLCMVLIIALLAPNAFAATPTPEAPLADAATVERVKQEIANGEITDMEDLFLVAYQHLGADLEEEGMTAYINEDGTLGLTQIIGSEKKMTKSGEMESKTIAVTSLALIDYSGELITAYESAFTELAYSVSGQWDEIMIYATQTTYLGVVPYNDGYYTYQNMKVLRVVTNLLYGTNAFTPSRLVQHYEYQPDAGQVSDSDTQTIYSPAAIAHTFYPEGDWETRETNLSRLLITSTVYIPNSSETVYLEQVFSLNSLYY